MQLVAIVIVLALLQYLYFGITVGMARGKYNVPAPATSGDPTWERMNRVHQNTTEQLILFIPAIVIFGTYANPMWAAILGVIWIIGRFIYRQSYIKDPSSRSLGFALTGLPSMIMLIGGLIRAIMTM